MSEILDRKIKQLKKALKTLQEIIAKRETIIIRDATIKRFEYTFEVLWKTLKIFLAEQKGLDVYSPKSVFREARNAELINDKETEKCLKMVDDRNATAHIYEGKGVQSIYKNIKKEYIDLIDMIETRLEEYL